MCLFFNFLLSHSCVGTPLSPSLSLSLSLSPSLFLVSVCLSQGSARIGHEQIDLKGHLYLTVHFPQSMPYLVSVLQCCLPYVMHF